MRAMPSPTSRTLPTSPATTWSLTPLNCSTSTETISSALNGMAAPLVQLWANRLETCANTEVIDPVPHADDQSAQDLRIHRLLQDWLEPGRLDQIGPQPGALGVGQWHRRPYLDLELAGMLL